MQRTRGVAYRGVARPTIEGAGVHLRRAFGFGLEHRFDPFLMLDDFRSDEPSEYLKGFPWHPHRGIETITYVLKGEVAHADSLGNSGVIGGGDVQWMTAGSGIIHQEMPHGDANGRMWGFQLWANLPADQKMRDPGYRGVSSAELPCVRSKDGSIVRIVAGEYEGVHGPVEGIAIEPEYLDVTVPPDGVFTHATPSNHTVIAYIFEGDGVTSDDVELADHVVVLYGEGDEIVLSAGEHGLRFLLLSGRPLREPIAWRGPIVMNTFEDVRDAFREYQEGSFVKVGSVPGTL